MAAMGIVRLRALTHKRALGLPVLCTLSLCTCYRHYPGAAAGHTRRKGRRVGLHIVLFEACSAFTRVAACTLARPPIRDPLYRRLQAFRCLHDCSRLLSA